MIICIQTATNRFSPWLLFFAMALLVFFPCHPVFGQIPFPPKKTIALLSDGQSEPQNHLTLRFQKALEILSEGEIIPVFKKSPPGNWGKKTSAEALKTALKDPEVDLIFINGPLLAGQALKTAQKHNKPIVGFFNFDPGFLLPEPSAGRQTLALAVIPGQVKMDLQTMALMFKTRELTILVDHYLLGQIKILKKKLIVAAQKEGFTATVQPIRKTVRETLKHLDKRIKTVYLTPGLQMPISQRKQLMGELNKMGYFVFSGAGLTDVQNGALVGQLPPMNERLARHTALNAMRFFSGMRSRKPFESLKPKRTLEINEATAAQVKYRVSDALMEKAREIEPGPSKKNVVAALPEVDRLPFDHYLKKNKTPALTLAQAVGQALKKNASLSVKEAKVEEDRQDRDRMLTELFPQVRGQVGYMRVDRNIAQRSFGMFPQDRTSAGIALSQLIYSDPVITKLRAANKNVDSALSREKSLRLDVGARTQEIYMDCLSAAALYWIREYNLKLTQQNLRTARDRKAAGTAGPQEVYRWETQEAHDRSQVIKAQSTLQSAMVGLNRIMGEEQNRIWSLENSRASEMQGAFNEKTFMSLVRNPADFRALTTYVVDTALETSPELESINSLIDATRILKGYYKRRFVVPEASVEFGYSHTLNQTFDNVPGIDPLTRMVPEDADNHWALQVKLDWSLFEGGGKVVDVRKNRATLRKLESLHREASQIVEERARNGLIKASAARSDMDLARVAAEAAKKNYKVVRDGYAQGVSTILDLLDAQRQTMVQERQAILSEYRFLKAIVEVERSMNRIAALEPKEEQEAWWRELKNRLGRNG